MIDAHLTGAFPRSESLVEVTRLADRGKASKIDVEAAFDRDCQALVQLQTQTELDYVVDGQLNWQDLFRPFSEFFTGIQLGSLTRWFDNNTFYRKPVITQKIASRREIIDEFFRHSFLPDLQRKAILPGPMSFALLCENNAYGDVADLIGDTAVALKAVVSSLRRLGYTCIQFNEPAISNEDRVKAVLQHAKQAYATCAKATGTKTSLHTYFADPAPILDALLDLPVDSVGVDFYQASVESIAEHTFNKELDCGCIDGRNSLLESPENVVKFVRRVQEQVEPKRTTVCPNCDLDFLPHPIAVQKTRLLGEVKKRLS